MVVVPVSTAATTPLGLTVATAGTLELHVTVRPASAAPAESYSVALSVARPRVVSATPTSRVADVALSLTEATGTAVTVTAAVPETPSVVAVIVAVPADFPVTTPDPLTVATAVLSLLHAMVCPPNVLPEASFGVAESVVVAPTRMDAVAGVTATLATVGGARMPVPSLPPHAAAARVRAERSATRARLARQGGKLQE